MLRVYCIFHLNLAYSSIEEEQRPEVIRRCYWPLLRLAHEYNLPFGIEATGYTLETIAAIDPDWISELRRLTSEGHCEFIGSGNSQIIGPLVPAEVNEANLRLGNQVYERLLGFRPNLALINEQAYSAGLVQHYLDAGYKGIIMEWNNPRKYSQEWNNEWRYFPQYAVGSDGEIIPLIWADSIAFQKFQRFVHGELDLDEHMEYLSPHVSDKPRVFPIYCNDVEIFNYRPRRYKTEAVIHKRSEWERIKVLFQTIKSDKRFQLISPCNVLDFLNYPDGGNRICLESPEQPIPVKKQEKYNINRWALTGRDDLGINTKCYQIYDAFRKAKSVKPTEEDWKELCYLWSSDFRTHITEKRWISYIERLHNFYERWESHTQHKAKENVEKVFLANDEDEQKIKTPCHNDRLQCLEDERYLTVETDSIKCILNKLKGLAIDRLWFKNISTEPLIGTLPHGYYDDISLGADFYSGHAIIERLGVHKITDLQKCEPEVFLKEKPLLCVRAEMHDREAKFKKEYLFDLFTHSLIIKLNIEIPGRILSTIHPLNITFIPTSFHRKSLFYATNNGGEKIEKFSMGGKIHHAQSLSSLISAKHGLGATKGLVIVGDEKKQLLFQHDQTKSAIIPSVHFLPMNDGQYFLRLQYSAQEMDDTCRPIKGIVGAGFLSVCLVLTIA